MVRCLPGEREITVVDPHFARLTRISDLEIHAPVAILQLLSQCGSTYNCQSRSVPDIYACVLLGR